MTERFHTTEQVVSCAANLCDLLRPDISAFAFEDAAAEFARLMSRAREQSGRVVDRLYAGSYFCDRYFCTLGVEGVARVVEFARKNGLSLTLVVPIFGQQTLVRGESIVEEVLHKFGQEDDPLDEICVNDYGTAAFVSGLCRGTGVCLGWGRLFARALRDPRYALFSSEPQRAPYDSTQMRALEADFGVSLVELDPFAPRVSLGGLGRVLPVALHLPHSYATTGHICEFASLSRPLSRKFRPDCACDCACVKTLSVYESRNDEDFPLYFSKQGRTVYFENPNCEVDDVAVVERIIWTLDDFNCPYALEWSDGDMRWA